MSAPTDIRTVVREKYGAIAEGKTSGCCGSASSAASKSTSDSSCGCGCSGGVLAEIGYSAEQAAAIPEGADLGLGCGNPIAYTGLKPGETVVDLGSGGGIDCFLAAREVGPAGQVIGVDMTPSMIERARANAAKGDYPRVEFRLGEIEHLPVADGTVDAIVSNCVINLSPDKPQVFREAMRVLKPGGRMLVSDLVLLQPLAPEQRQSVELYVGCVAGASLKDDYLALMREAGFRNVEILSESGYTVGADQLPEGSIERRAFEVVSSIKVRAVKP